MLTIVGTKSVPRHWVSHSASHRALLVFCCNSCFVSAWTLCDNSVYGTSLCDGRRSKVPCPCQRRPVDVSRTRCCTSSAACNPCKFSMVQGAGQVRSLLMVLLLWLLHLLLLQLMVHSLLMVSLLWLLHPLLLQLMVRSLLMVSLT